MKTLLIYPNTTKERSSILNQPKHKTQKARTIRGQKFVNQRILQASLENVHRIVAIQTLKGSRPKTYNVIDEAVATLLKAQEAETE